MYVFILDIYIFGITNLDMFIHSNNLQRIIITETYELGDLITFFQRNNSTIYYIFHESFYAVDLELKQKGIST